ncbi:MAG: substrate-binding domain-containing protein [Clostridiales bacterium]|nr:substrate-binding domain-containing protein [Clostridiales bacterium]
MKAVFALFLAVLLALSACGGIQESEVTEPPEQSEPLPQPTEPPAKKDMTISDINAENYPNIDGSTANLPLMAKLYSEICEVPIEVAETMVTVSGGTGAAWRTFFWQNDNADMLIIYEAPDSVAEQFSDDMAKLEIDPIGRDGLVFLVNKSNPVDNLTTEQLQDIYTGKITDWRQVGGDPGPIAAFQRNQESGSQTLFLKLLMDGEEPMDPPSELVPGSMGGLIEAVAGFDGSGGAIGYSVFYYADLMYANPDLKLLSVDGIAPSFDTIASGEYPFVNDFYVVIRTNEPKNSPARILRDWLLTEEGAALLKSANYVPVLN